MDAAINIYNVSLVEIEREAAIWQRLILLLIKRNQPESVEFVCPEEYSMAVSGIAHPLLRKDIVNMGELIADKLLRFASMLFGLDTASGVVNVRTLLLSFKRYMGFAVPYSSKLLQVRIEMAELSTKSSSIWMLYVIASNYFKCFNDIFEESVSEIFELGLARLVKLEERNLLMVEYFYYKYKEFEMNESSGMEMDASAEMINSLVPFFERMEAEGIPSKELCLFKQFSTLSSGISFCLVKETCFLDLMADRIIPSLPLFLKAIAVDLLKQKYPFYERIIPYRLSRIFIDETECKKEILEFLKWNPKSQYLWKCIFSIEKDPERTAALYETALSFINYGAFVYIFVSLILFYSV